MIDELVLIGFREAIESPEGWIRKARNGTHDCRFIWLLRQRQA